MEPSENTSSRGIVEVCSETNRLVSHGYHMLVISVSHEYHMTGVNVCHMRRDTWGK